MRWRRAHPGKTLRAARRANKARTRPRSRRPEARISYRKAVEALTAYFEGPDDIDSPTPRAEAHRILGAALTPKQRDALKETSP